MQLKSSPKRHNLVICFTAREAQGLASCLEVAFEEEKQKGTHVPELERDFFRNFSKIEKRFTIEFSFEYLELGAAFLEEIHEEMSMKGSDTTEVENFLIRIQPFCADNSIIH